MTGDKITERIQQMWYWGATHMVLRPDLRPVGWGFGNTDLANTLKELRGLFKVEQLTVVPRAGGFMPASRWLEWWEDMQ